MIGHVFLAVVMAVVILGFYAILLLLGAVLETWAQDRTCEFKTKEKETSS